MSKPARASADGRAYLDLQNLARRQHRSTQELLVLYVLERFLARLAASEHRDSMIATLAHELRNDTHEVLARVVEIADTSMSPDDGVAYLTGTA